MIIPIILEKIISVSFLRGGVKYYFADFVRKWGGHYGLTGYAIKMSKCLKKVRNGAQKSGMITRNLELIIIFASN